MKKIHDLYQPVILIVNQTNNCLGNNKVLYSLRHLAFLLPKKLLAIL